MKIKFFIAWYDFWVGWFWDRKKCALYICLLPCCVIQIDFKRQLKVQRYFKEEKNDK